MAGTDRHIGTRDGEATGGGRLDAATLDALPDPVIVLDAGGRVAGANVAARRLIGPALDAAGLFACLVAEPARDLWEQLRDRAASGATLAPTDLDLALAPERTLPVEVSLAPRAGGGAVAVLRDASARRFQDDMTRRMLSDMEEHRLRVEAQAAEIITQAEALHVSERRLHLILESTHDAYWDWDVDAGRLDFSARFAEALGLSAGTAESVDAFVQRVHPADREAVRAGFARVEARRAVDVPLGEFRLQHGDGRVRWVAARGQVVTRDETGRARRALGMLSDINERKERDEEQQRQQRLEAVGGLAAGVAHEINTPLQLVGDNLTFLADHLHHVTALLEALERLRADLALWQRWRDVTDDLLPPGAEDDLAYMKAEFPLAVRESIDGIERVSRIVRALKEFAHPGQTERERVDIRRVIENAITLTRNQWKFAAEVVTDYGPLPDAVFCSQGECTQLLVNLIINAAQAMAAMRREGKGTIAVRARAVDAHCVIEVTDSGPGIPAEIQGRVFDPFFTTKPVGQGTGQGLPLARAIVQRHGGTIGFESVPGQGTTFTVRLPLTTGASAASAA
jgi:PAS domain S-box-containing protein